MQWHRARSTDIFIQTKYLAVHVVTTCMHTVTTHYHRSLSPSLSLSLGIKGSINKTLVLARIVSRVLHQRMGPRQRAEVVGGGGEGQDSNADHHDEGPAVAGVHHLIWVLDVDVVICLEVAFLEVGEDDDTHHEEGGLEHTNHAHREGLKAKSRVATIKEEHEDVDQS